MTTSLSPCGTHRELAAIARRLHCIAEQSASVDTVLASVTREAIAIVEPAQHAGATVVPPAQRTRRDTAATSHVATLYAALERSQHQGPTREAVSRQRTITVDDLADDDRWPALGQALSSATSRHSCVVLPLATDTGGVMGALTLFADHPVVFDSTAVDVAESLSAHAALAVMTAQRAAQFHAALSSRDVIGQAKGLIMERFSISADEAFSLLTKLSQDANLKLAIIAERLVTVGHSRSGDTPARTGEQRSRSPRR